MGLFFKKTAPKLKSNVLKKINNIIAQLHPFVLICFFVAFNFCLSFVLNILSKIILQSSFTQNAHHFSSLTDEIFLVVIISPFIETAIFQYIIIELLFDKFKKEIICIVSAIIFACTHLYNLMYFIFAFIIGLTFAYLYLIGRLKKRGFLYVYMTHIIYNFIAVTLNHL